MMAKQKLKLIAMLTTLATISFCGGQTLEKEVVVIGGGIAGLSAARQILNRGLGNYTVRVYEARRERYGGRVWTNRLKNPHARGLEVDLGGFALNVASPFTNPLLNLTRDLQLETAELSRPQFIVPWLNKKFSDEDLLQAMVDAKSIILDAVNMTRQRGKDRSVQQAVDQQLKERPVDKNSPQYLLLKSFASYVIDDYSALHYQPNSLDFGYKQVLLDGMGEILDRLVSGTPDERPLKIRLRTAVRQIKVDRSQDKVVLRLRDGSQVAVDKVVVAVPAPVIVNGEVLFEPSLPKEYQFALTQIGMTASNKVIVEFDSPFWPNDHGIFMVAAQTEEERGNLQTWFNIYKLLGKPVLMGMLQGDAARNIESLSDEEVQSLVLKKLHIMFGEGAVKRENLVKIHRSQWVSDALTGGASSYPRVGNTPAMWNTLAEPLCPYIYFAGEHTIFRDHGTLHGAYISGIRAADQLLSGYCEQKALEEERRRAELKKKKEEEKGGSKGGDDEETPTRDEGGDEGNDDSTRQNDDVKDEL